jgi:hypothetical protein
MSSSVIAAMRSAHERLMRAVYEAARSVRAAPRDTQPGFAEFRVCARRHMAGEEQHLFPLLEAQGCDVSALRHDHRQLADAIARAEDALGRGKIEEFYDIAQELILALSAHRIREERRFVANADAILGGAGAELLERLRAIFSE